VEARVRLRRISTEGLFLPRLPAPARRAFLFCTKYPLLRRPRWYLAGGTALSLQVEHRQSADLDFFTPLTGFRKLEVERALLATDRWKTDYLEQGTIYGTLLEAKVSLIAYPLFVPSARMLVCGNLRMLIPQDIAVMKIIAISQRGRKRDFVDLYWYCVHRNPLREIISRVLKQYPGKKHNLPHSLKNLTYFDDAESDPMPRLFFDATWGEIKRFFKREATRIARELLDIS
jgi:hypothetical protein